MKRMILLMIVALITISAAGLMNQFCEPVKAEEEKEKTVAEIVIPTATPTPTPSVNFDLTHLSIVCPVEEVRNDKAGIHDTGTTPDDRTAGHPEQAVYDTEGQEDDQTDPEGQETDGQQEPKEQLIYLGTWTITAYCPCKQCCGPWASGYTASGNPAVAGHTVACNVLPFGSRVLIGGAEYVVEDTGNTDFGNEWMDIFFNTHEEALAFGVKDLGVYLITNEE